MESGGNFIGRMGRGGGTPDGGGGGTAAEVEKDEGGGAEDKRDGYGEGGKVESKGWG